jgi:hypothetical protein
LERLSGKRRSDEYISFIFMRPASNMDFLRRHGGCSRRWVVGGIGAALDLTKINDFLQVAARSRGSRYLCVVIK